MGKHSEDSDSGSSSAVDEKKKKKEKKAKSGKGKKKGAKGPRLVVLVRHGEKPPKALDLDGKLSRVGELRARFLAERWFALPPEATDDNDPDGFKPTFFSFPIADNRTITHLFAAKPDPANRRRLRMELTLLPLSRRLGVPIDPSFEAEDYPALANEIRGLKNADIVLVCFPHEDIPGLARDLLYNGINSAGGHKKWKSAVPGWEKEDYHSVWCISEEGKLDVLDMDEVKGKGAEKTFWFEGFVQAEQMNRLALPVRPKGPRAPEQPIGQQVGQAEAPVAQGGERAPLMGSLAQRADEPQDEPPTKGRFCGLLP